MKKFYDISEKNNIQEIDFFQNDCWINIISPSQDEISWLADNYGIDIDDINSMLDIDEQPRYEKNKTYIFFIIRTPLKDEYDENITYRTRPIGIIFLKNCFVTISLQENVIIKNIIDNKIKNINIFSKNTFLLTLMLRASKLYLIYLRTLNEETTKIEEELKKSIQNHKLFNLLTIDKSLVFFTTALKLNQLLLRSIQKDDIIRLDKEETELLKDALTENMQASSIADIYSDVLNGMMDTFASIISNNQNIIMEKLTSISLVLMIPTLIASIYGMNVDLPLQNHIHSFAIIAVSSACLTIILFIFFKLKKYL